MPASFSIRALAATRHCGRSRAIVACSVPTARFRARRSRPSGRVRRAPLRAVPHSHHGKRYSPKLARLAQQPSHERVGMVDSESGHRCGAFLSFTGANRDVDHRARLDGHCVHSECKAVRADPLPLHGPLLSRDDRTGARACFGCRFRRLLCVAFIGGSHSWRKHDHLVGHGKGVGKILVEPSMQAPGARCQCNRHGQRRPIEQ